MGQSDPDDELLARVAKGDPAAVRALVARKLPRILSLAHRMLGDAALRSRLAAAGAVSVRRRYSLEAVLARWDQLIGTVRGARIEGVV